MQLLKAWLYNSPDIDVTHIVLVPLQDVLSTPHEERNSMQDTG